MSVPDSLLNEPIVRPKHEPGCRGDCTYCCGSIDCPACDTVHHYADACPVPDGTVEEG